MPHSIVDTIVRCLRAYPAETRLLGFILAFAMVWAIAPGIDDFVRGFFDGVSAARSAP
jgi:hypothetical protein